MLRVRQRLGKYRIERRRAVGGFATVYQAYDTVTGVHVALKIAHEACATATMLEDFRREARMAARLDHPNVLPIKDAGFIDGLFVITSPLGKESLAERMQRRIGLATLLSYTDQMLEAAAYAHERRIMHCDIKPDNLILFDGNRLRLADFGVARVARRSQRGSGSGTVGYVAPEQAMGKPSLRSDVFSLGLVIYHMFSGALPEWPFDWPMKGYGRLTARLHPAAVAFLRRALMVDSDRRYADAVQMLEAYRRVRARFVKSPLRRVPSRRETHRTARRVRVARTRSVSPNRGR